MDCSRAHWQPRDTEKHGIDDGALVCGPHIEEHPVAVDVAWLII